MNEHKKNFKPISHKLDSGFLIVGLVRNCQSKIKADVLRLKKAMSLTRELHWLLIESDSTDFTLSELEKLTRKIKNFRYISLGDLCTKLPLRTQRIAHCRNEYIKEIRESSNYHDIDYVIVSDFDGINTHLSDHAIDSCWENDNWDMCAANQRGPYYDIWALRHKYWSPNDCWAQFNFFSAYEPSTEKNLNVNIYSRMIKLPIDGEWIEVDSAFGGIAIYKKELFFISEYNGLNESGEEFCEHVHFHQKLKQSGAKLFINPRLVNAEYTEHTVHLLLYNSIIRKSKAFIKKIILALTGKKIR